MKLKSISAFLLGLMLVFTSCDQKEVSPTAAAESESIDLVLLATANPGNDTTATGTRQGKHCNLTEVAVSELPASITSYISTNYAGASVERAGKVDNSTYTVHVKKADGTSVGLLFDASGNFVLAKSHKQVHGTEVAVTGLPAAITDYVSDTYAGATIVKAMQHSQGHYMVAITKADATVAGLAFDASGTFIREVTLQGKRGGGKGKGHR
jgi:hypothetical protein